MYTFVVLSANKPIGIIHDMINAALFETVLKAKHTLIVPLIRMMILY